MENPNEPLTLRDELEFINNATLKVDNVIQIDRDEYREYGAVNQSLIKKVLEHGLNAGKRIYDEQDTTDDILLGRYYHSVCAGDDISKIYMVVPKLDRRTKEGKALWLQYSTAAESSGLTPISEEVANKASTLAIDAFKLMRALNPAGGAKPDYELSLVASVSVTSPKHTISNFRIKGQLDYVEVLNCGKVFVGDYKTAPSSTEVAVRRKSRDSNWPLQAYTYTLLASAFYNKPAECSYVVSSKDHMTHRAYDISQHTLEEGKKSLIQGIFRMYFQSTNDETYLRRATL